MKKLTALLFAIAGVMSFMLTGCSNSEEFTEKTYHSADAEIASIIIQTTDRELEIVASEDNQIQIDYFDGKKEYLNIAVSDKNELIVKLEFDKKPSDFFGLQSSDEYRKIHVRIPNDIISDCSLVTTNEDIRISSVSLTDRMNVNVNGGNIFIEKVNVGKAIELTAKNGNITGSVLGGWDDYSMLCNVKKGECNLPANKEEGEKSLFANCNNGNIDIEFVK